MNATALDRAIQILGSQSALAAAISTEERPVKQQNVSWWVNQGKGVVPGEYCIAIEKAVDEAEGGAHAGEVTRYDLRRDIFGPAPTDKAA